MVNTNVRVAGVMSAVIVNERVSRWLSGYHFGFPGMTNVKYLWED